MFIFSIYISPSVEIKHSLAYSCLVWASHHFYAIRTQHSHVKLRVHELIKCCLYRNYVVVSVMFLRFLRCCTCVRRPSEECVWWCDHSVLVRLKNAFGAIAFRSHRGGACAVWSKRQTSHGWNVWSLGDVWGWGGPWVVCGVRWWVMYVSLSGVLGGEWVVGLCGLMVCGTLSVEWWCGDRWVMCGGEWLVFWVFTTMSWVVCDGVGGVMGQCWGGDAW